MTEHLGMLARFFAALDADRGVTAGSVLSELLRALSLYGDLGEGVYPPRGTAPEMSRALAVFRLAVARAVQRCQASPSPALPSGLPAGLEVPVDTVGCDLQPAGSSVADEIPLREAGALLGLSSERARQLIHAREIDGWQEPGGRRQWHATRASVIACGERRSA